MAWSFTQCSKFDEWSLQTAIANGSCTRSLLFKQLDFESRRIGITTNAVAAPDAACLTSVIKPCVESSHRGQCIRHDRMHHSHACFRNRVQVTALCRTVQSVEADDADIVRSTRYQYVHHHSMSLVVFGEAINAPSPGKTRQLESRRAILHRLLAASRNLRWRQLEYPERAFHQVQ